MASNKKKSFLKNIITTTNQGCGSSCGKDYIPQVYQPKPITRTPSTINYTSTDSDQKPPTQNYLSTSLSSSSQDLDDEDCSTSTDNMPCIAQFEEIGETVAVLKDSDDPYLDFRRSMIEMILEKEIYKKDGLEELLKCFLDLNSPTHHGIIIKAFIDIWN